MLVVGGWRIQARVTKPNLASLWRGRWKQWDQSRSFTFFWIALKHNRAPLFYFLFACFCFISASVFQWCLSRSCSRLGRQQHGWSHLSFLSPPYESFATFETFKRCEFIFWLIQRSSVIWLLATLHDIERYIDSMRRCKPILHTHRCQPMWKERSVAFSPLQLSLIRKWTHLQAFPNRKCSVGYPWSLISAGVWS